MSENNTVKIELPDASVTVHFHYDSHEKNLALLEAAIRMRRASKIALELPWEQQIQPPDELREFVRAIREEWSKER